MKKHTVRSLVLVIGILLASCAPKEPITKDFVSYDSTEFIAKYGIGNVIPVFTIGHPPTWQQSWFSDSGAVAFLMSSGDVNAAWGMQDKAGATLLILPTEYSGEKLTDLFFAILRGIEYDEPAALKINDQDAARIEYRDNGRLTIEVVILHDRWVLNVAGFFPAEKESQFRPLIDAMIGTIVVQ